MADTDLYQTTIEDIVGRYTPLDLKSCSVGRFLLISAFQGHLSRPYSGSSSYMKNADPKQRELDEGDQELLAAQISDQLGRDELATREGLETLLLSMLDQDAILRGEDENLAEMLDQLFLPPDDSDGVFRTKGEYLRFLRTEASTVLGIRLDPVTRTHLDDIIELYGESLDDMPLNMTFVAGEQYVDGIDYISIREKTPESLALKILNRYSRVFGVTDSKARSFISDGSFHVETDQGEILTGDEAKEFKRTFTSDRLSEYVFQTMLSKFMAGGMDYFDYHRSFTEPEMVRYEVIGIPGIKRDRKRYTVNATLTPDIVDLIGDFFLFDGTGARICPSPNSRWDNLIKGMSNPQTLENFLGRRLGDRQSILPGGIENNYNTDRKDGSLVVGISGPRSGSYFELRAHSAISMIRAESDPKRAHIKYKHNSAIEVEAAVKRSKLMKIAALNICETLGVEPGSILPSYGNGRLEREVEKIYN